MTADNKTQESSEKISAGIINNSAKAPCSSLKKGELEIHKEVSMRPYETAFLIAPNLPEEDNDKLIDQMAEIVSKEKGKMIHVDKWGKRRLAYPIQKYEEAYYVFFLYEGEPAVLAELERRFKQTEAILRYLTVRTEVKEPVKKKSKAAPKRKKKEPTPKEESPPVEVAPKEDMPEEPALEGTAADAVLPDKAEPEDTASDESPPDVSTPPEKEPQGDLPAEEKIKEEA
jgi:small subunit ribosomal protein S6